MLRQGHRNLPTNFTLKDLIQKLPQKGRVEWIGVRPDIKAPLQSVDTVKVLTKGLQGDHYSGGSGKRSVTLIQAEHIQTITSLLHKKKRIDPAELRRNIVISGINLLALKDREFTIGSAVLKMTGLCHPCSRMEEILGEGGYNAVRGHGGINASVISQGIIKLGDTVEVVELLSEDMRGF